MKKTLLLISALALSGAALAKLPAPSDEAKAKAAEAAAKTAHGNKVADYQLCKSREKNGRPLLQDHGQGQACAQRDHPRLRRPRPLQTRRSAGSCGTGCQACTGCTGQTQRQRLKP